jgi:hypothetical protein
MSQGQEFVFSITAIPSVLLDTEQPKLTQGFVLLWVNIAGSKSKPCRSVHISRWRTLGVLWFREKQTDSV